jgi:hypothetical protein
MFPNFEELQAKLEAHFAAILQRAEDNAKLLEAILAKLAEPKKPIEAEEILTFLSAENINKFADQIENAMLARTLELAKKSGEFATHPQFAPVADAADTQTRNSIFAGASVEFRDGHAEEVEKPATHSTPDTSGATHSKPLGE